jgi:hypothetical protein
MPTKTPAAETPAETPAKKTPAAKKRAASDKNQERKNKKAQEKRAAEAEVEKAPPSRLDGPSKREGDTYFSRGDMLELQLGTERLKHAETELARCRMDIKRVEAEFLAARSKAADGAARADVARAKMAAELAKLHQEIGEAYAMSLKNISFNTDTGKITQHD